MKPLKIFWNGQLLKEVYPHATRWQVFKYRVRRFFRKVLIGTSIIFGAYVIFQAGGYFNASTIYEVRAQEVRVDTLNERVQDLKWEVVDGIKNWETKNIPIPNCDGKIIFDTNKVASIGCYQYQVKTVVHYIKILDGKDISDAEAIAIATDHDKARALAYRIVWEQNALTPNWYNYSNLQETKTTVAIIKKLDQK